MVWRRHDFDTKNMKWILGFLLVLLAMAMAFLQFPAAAVIVFIMAVIGLQMRYFHQVGKNLTFRNDHFHRRVLYGGDSYWKLIFKNEGLPIWGGHLKIWFHDVVEPRGMEFSSYGDLVEMDVPFTIGSNQTIDIEVPLTGKRRGVSHIKKMEVFIPHPFGDGSMTLEYEPKILQEQLVFPKLQKYPFRYAPSRHKPGQFNLQHSLFDDAFQPVGTRDYVSTDQFNQIHWKASVRMQNYQTKIFSQVANESMLFALNVSALYGTIHDLEERIEELASYIENCFRTGVPYAVAVNIRSAGKTPYLYLASGQGQKQRQQALELLAVISKNSSTLPYRSMLGHLDLHIELPYTTYLLTNEPQEAMRFITKWSSQTELMVMAGKKERDPA